jgi:TRAP-type C4-dicarboxylate transport system permease small subunit
MDMAKKGMWALVLALMSVAPVWAQDTVARPGKDLLSSIVSTLIFGCIGIVLAIVGFKMFDIVIKHDIEKEIFDNKNMAAAVLAGAVVLGVCLIIAATLLSP